MHDTAENPYVEEDEISLIDLLLVIMKHKVLIIVMVLLTGIGAVLFSLHQTNIYRSEATIVPKIQEKTGLNPLNALGGFGGAIADDLGLGGGGSLEKFEVALKSRNLTSRVIKKHDMLPLLFPETWNTKEKKWETEISPTLQDGWKAIQNLLTIKSDTQKNTLNIGFDHPDPKTAKNVLGYFLTELSEVLREEVLEDATENMRFFKKQLEQTRDPMLQEKIYTLLAKEIEKETFARAQEYYSFLILDPPFAPDKDKKVKPKRAMICILSVTVAFFLSVFAAFFLEYFQRMKAEEPETYGKLKNAMRLRSRGK